MQDQIMEKAITYITQLFESVPGSHDAAHTMRVYRNTQLIARDEPGCDMETALLAALLHDADDHKLFQTENNANARKFLDENGIPQEQADRICETINAVSFSKNRNKVPQTLEAKVVQDADRLDAIGAVGVARTFAFGGEHGRSLEDSIQHFHDKLLLLKGLMNTETGKRMAEGRHAFLIAFLDEYARETKGGSI